MDGRFFNLRRLQAHTKTAEKLSRELLFANDAALVAHTETAACFAEAAEPFGLEVSLKRTGPSARSSWGLPSTQYLYHADPAEYCPAVLLPTLGVSSPMMPELTRNWSE